MYRVLWSQFDVIGIYAFFICLAIEKNANYKHFLFQHIFDSCFLTNFIRL